MSNTHFHDDHEMIVPNRAYSYAPKEGGGFKNSVLSYANAGATSLFTTAEDLTRWMGNFFDARVGGPGVIRQMQEQGILNDGKTIDYAFGLMIGQYRDSRPSATAALMPATGATSCGSPTGNSESRS